MYAGNLTVVNHLVEERGLAGVPDERERMCFTNTVQLYQRRVVRPALIKPDRSRTRPSAMWSYQVGASRPGINPAPANRPVKSV